MMGSFLSLDLFMFFIFFEIVLVPMYFLIGGWGYERRVYAATKFFLFTMVGSAFMLVGVIATAFLAREHGVGELTFDLTVIAERADFPVTTARWLFFAFAIAFAVKVPIFPLHTWLPDAHTQAPTAGSVILAAVHAEARHLRPPALRALPVPRGGRVGPAAVPDARRHRHHVRGRSSRRCRGTSSDSSPTRRSPTSASSCSASFAITSQSITGGVMQMVNHGISTGALFLLVGWIYERRHTRQISELRGLQAVAPIFAAGFMVVMLSSIGVPGLNGFVGEYLILIGSFQSARWWTVVAATGVILAAVYLLWAYQRVFHGEPDEANRGFAEIEPREAGVLGVLIAIIVFTGVYPKPMLDRIEPSVTALIEHVEERTGDVAPEPTPVEAREMRFVLQDATAFDGPPVSWFSLSPILVLVGAALFLLVAGALTPPWPRGWYAFVTAAAAGAAGVLSIVLWDDVSDDGPSTLVGRALAFDTFAMFVTITICAGSCSSPSSPTTTSAGRAGRAGGVRPHVLVAATGGVVMGAANDLIVLFLGLETLSLALYVLAASNRRKAGSSESGIKYFVLGGFSSAFFLYGIALVYGATGSTNITEMVGHAAAVRSPVERNDALVLAGIALLLVGLGFKVAAVPFHVWTPDVYQGAPTPVSAFMASVGKVAAFAAMIRVLVVALPFYRDDWRPRDLGAGACSRSSSGRCSPSCRPTSSGCWPTRRSATPASSSSASRPPATAPARSTPGSACRASLVYLLAYAVLVVGTFAVVTLVARTRRRGHRSATPSAGSAAQRPTLALALTVFLVAQAGVPFTSGFIAKFGVIRAAVDEQSYTLAIIAMIASVIAAFIYLRIMVNTWMVEPADGRGARTGARAVLHRRGDHRRRSAFTLVVGIVPAWLLDAADVTSQFAR